MSQDLTNFHPTNLPLTQWVSVWDGESLKRGDLSSVYRFTFTDRADAVDSVPPPQISKNHLIRVFLGLFANDETIDRELLGATGLYFGAVTADAVVSHLASWDYWESEQHDMADSCDSESSRVLCNVSQTNVYQLPRPYVEAVLHLCARERLGPSWPRRIHSMVVHYLLTKDDHEGPSFELIGLPRLFGIKEGTIDGYHLVKSVTCQGQNGVFQIISTGVSKRETLQRLKGDPNLQAYVQDNWKKLKGQLNTASGYERRREISQMGLDQVRWLFHRHILGETTKQIASEFNNAVTTVEKAIKDLRWSLDLQPKHAVHCLAHKRLPQRLHAS